MARPILLSWSSGKDSAWALHLLRRRDDLEVVGLVTTVLVTVVALISARVAIRIQYFIMGGIALSLISLFFGGTATVVAPTSF